MSEAGDWQRHIRTLRGVMGVCHLLIEPDERGVVLLDTGLVNHGRSDGTCGAWGWARATCGRFY
jgi:hypothetical protein